MAARSTGRGSTSSRATTRNWTMSPLSHAAHRAAGVLRDHAHEHCRRMISSAPTSIGRRCSAVRSARRVRAIVRRSRTRSTALATAMGIRCFWSRKVWTRIWSTRMVSRHRCPRMCSLRSSDRWQGWSAPRSSFRAMRWSMTISIRARSTTACRCARFRACTAQGRSMARPGTKRPLRKDWLPGWRQRRRCSADRSSCPTGRPAILR